MSTERMQEAEFWNIPRARVSPTVSESSRRPFPCQSEVFVHCPLSSWLTWDTLGCVENKLHIWSKPLVAIFELHNSAIFRGGPGLTPWGFVLWLTKSQEDSRWEVKTEVMEPDREQIWWIFSASGWRKSHDGILQSSSTDVPDKPQQGWHQCDIQLVSRRKRQKCSGWKWKLSCFEGFSTVVSPPSLVCCCKYPHWSQTWHWLQSWESFYQHSSKLLWKTQEIWREVKRLK